MIEVKDAKLNVIVYGTDTIIASNEAGELFILRRAYTNDIICALEEVRRRIEDEHTKGMRP